MIIFLRAIDANIDYYLPWHFMHRRRKSEKNIVQSAGVSDIADMEFINETIIDPDT